MPKIRMLGVAVVLGVVAAACSVHIVGDSTAALVQYAAGESGLTTMSGSTEAGCGFGHFIGERVPPSSLGSSPGYASCVLDWNENAPDDPGDMIVTFVSIHDAMCSTVDGCLPPDTNAYLAAHADLISTGHTVAWVEVPPSGDTAMQSRLDELNTAVAAALECTLVDAEIRIDDTYDGVHYLSLAAAWRVGARLSLLGPADACP